MFDVLVVGELNVDIILDQIAGFPEIGKEKLSENLKVTLGSSSAIFASNLSILGANVAMLGKTGKDDFAQMVRTSLEDKGVNTDLILSSENFNTGATIVLNYGMDRAMVTYPGAMEHLSEDEVSDETLSLAKHLHVSSVFLQPALMKGLVSLFRRAKSLGLTTSLDPQWDPSEKWELNLVSLLPFVDVFLPNRKELHYLTGCESVEEGVDKLGKFCNILAIKDGENGSILFSKGKIIKKDAFLNQDVEDCIGAGDSFDAGFISRFIQGKSLDVCQEFANLSGAVNTTKAGGTTAFESLDRFKQIAKERFSYPL